MFCIKVFSLPFSAWGFRCDQNHQGLHYLLINSLLSNFLQKKEPFKSSVKNRPDTISCVIKVEWEVLSWSLVSLILLSDMDPNVLRECAQRLLETADLIRNTNHAQPLTTITTSTMASGFRPTSQASSENLNGSFFAENLTTKT